MKKSGKIIAGIMAMTMAGVISFPEVNSTIPVIQSVNKVTYAAEKGAAEKFVESAEDIIRSTVYIGDVENGFEMNGRKYYQGVVLGDGEWQKGSEVSFNVENLKNVSFDFGHIDNSNTGKSTISIYVDNVLTEQFEITGQDIIKQCSVDVSGASKMRITSSSDYSQYAMGSISVDDVKTATPAVVPEYKTAEDFVRGNYNIVRATAYDDSDSPNALDRKKFNMGGRTYYQGIVLGDGEWQKGSEVSFNVENLKNVSFDFGHIDNSNTGNSIISIYVDEVMIEQFEINGHDLIKQCSVDVSKASKMRITSSSDYSQYAMGNIYFDSVKAATPAVVPEYETAEDFVRSNYNSVRATALDDSDSPNALDRKKFNMGGRTYYQGVILGDGEWQKGSEVSFNVENLNSVSFDFGHIDNSSVGKSTISIYLDGVLTEQFEITGHDIIKQCSVDVSKVSKMRITSSSDYSQYAMANISVDSVKAATPAVVPEYETAEDFIRGNYNGVRTTVLDDSDSPNAVDRKQFNMNGKTYYQGIILGDGEWQNGSEVSFNVENLSSISFDFGHIDNSDTKKSTISIYLDNIMKDEFEVTGEDEVIPYSIDVSNASKVRITSSSNYSQYAMGNISIDSSQKPDPSSNVTLFGDTNEDKKVSISDAVLIMQSIANPDEFKITEQGKTNADVVDNGNGITNMDALAIQYVEIKTITPDAFPLTSSELDALSK